MSEPPLDPPFVSQAELAKFLKMTPTSPEATSELLGEVLDAAIEHVSSKVGPLTGAGAPYRVYANGRHLVLPATHVLELGAVTDPHGQVLDPDVLEVNLLSGIITVPSRVKGAWTVMATTRDHGASLRLAVKIIASHLWETQRGRSAGGARPVVFTPSGGDVATVPRGFAIPTRAAELIAPFQQVTI